MQQALACARSATRSLLVQEGDDQAASAYSVYLRYWYKGTNTDAEGAGMHTLCYTTRSASSSGRRPGRLGECVGVSVRAGESRVRAGR